MAKLHDLTGKKFGNWLVLYRNGSTANKASIWHCRCLICGSEHDIVGASIYNGLSTKCRSCVPTLTLSKPHRKDRIYNIYRAMKSRCYNPNNSHYKNYGGRGINICEEWMKSPDAFIEWSYSNGYTDGLTIDRIDVNGNYEPSNCRFISVIEQSHNKSNNIFISYHGDNLCLSVMCRKYGVNYNSVRSAVRRGLNFQQAFEKLVH